MDLNDPRNKKYKAESCSRPRRIYELFFLIFIIAAAICLKLYTLQVRAHGYYLALAEGQHSVLKNLIPVRGEIFLKDKNGLYPVAVNKNTKMAYAVPREIEDLAMTASRVSQILGLDEQETKEKLENPEDMYEVLKHRLNDEEITSLQDAKLSGIHLSEETTRYYPAGELASQVLGFVGWKNNDFSGRYGIENFFESELKGEEGRLFQKRDSSGGWISTGVKEITPAKNGDSLILTIDHIIQYESEKILKSAVDKFKADKGTVIVMESKTGNILALANYPAFDPNNYGNEDMGNFRNAAISDPYECGSVFKTVTLASAIDSDKISPNTTYIDTGQVAEAGYIIRNSDLKANGVQTMTQVLEKSLNTGAIYAEKLLGNRNFSDYVKRFGLGTLSGIELPGENSGNIANLKEMNRNINFFTASFGQGISVTPIQLVSAYNAIANGGVLMKPRIIERIIKPDSEEETMPQEVRKVISQNAANEMTQILRSVVVNGHGKRADVPGYAVAGKTGTAQIASLDKKGYEEGKNIGTFAGYAPIENPEFTVLVKIDNPEGVEWAESSAAPTFGELMKFLLDYRNIEPTENYSQKDMDLFNQTHNLSRSFIDKKEKKELDSL